MLADARSLYERGDGPEVESYRIKSFPREAYRPAFFVEQTGTPELYRELSDLLGQLWEINEEHVGELNTDVNVYFALTGIHAALSERLMDWCGRYLALRVVRENPRDHGSSFLKYGRLLAEYMNAFGIREQSLDYLLADASQCLAAWYLFEHTWKHDVKVIRDGGDTLVGTANPDFQAYALAQIEKFRVGLEDLPAFLDEVAEASRTSERLTELNRFSDSDLLQ